MRTEERFDCVVIGAGVQGSFTAYQLAKQNRKTLLLEQVGQTSSGSRTMILRGNSRDSVHAHVSAHFTFIQPEEQGTDRAHVRLRPLTRPLLMSTCPAVIVCSVR